MLGEVEQPGRINSSMIYNTYSCVNCGKEVTKANTMKKYCSNKCQQHFQSEEKIRLGTAGIHCLKHHLIKHQGMKCYNCGITKWQNKDIVMDLEHLDGNSTNNDLTNLRLICPNCHSQTSTYKNRNKGRGRLSRRLRYHTDKKRKHTPMLSGQW